MIPKYFSYNSWIWEQSGSICLNADGMENKLMFFECVDDNATENSKGFTLAKTQFKLTEDHDLSGFSLCKNKLTFFGFIPEIAST